MEEEVDVQPHLCPSARELLAQPQRMSEGGSVLHSGVVMIDRQTWSRQKVG